MINQDAPSRLCECGRDRVFTAKDRGGKYNSKVDGKTVCSICAFEDIYAKARMKAKNG